MSLLERIVYLLTTARTAAAVDPLLSILIRCAVAACICVLLCSRVTSCGYVTLLWRMMQACGHGTPHGLPILNRRRYPPLLLAGAARRARMWQTRSLTLLA